MCRVAAHNCSRPRLIKSNAVMKNQRLLSDVCSHSFGFALWILLTIGGSDTHAAPATLLFEDHFTGGIPGWTAVQPAGGNYIDSPMLWEYDVLSGAFSEQSNLYTDSATFSVTRIASMLINDTVAPSNFTYTARLTAGDDDGFGLIWGFQNQDTFYRVIFGRQNRTGWPFTGWAVDRLNNGQITDLFGAGTSNHVPTFVNRNAIPFDVTVRVTNNLLTLTVIDDPDLAPSPTDGLAAEDIPKLFQRFWRKDAARSSSEHSGLGLSLAEAFAGALGMTLRAELVQKATLAMTLEGRSAEGKPPA